MGDDEYKHLVETLVDKCSNERLCIYVYRVNGPCSICSSVDSYGICVAIDGVKQLIPVGCICSRCMSTIRKNTLTHRERYYPEINHQLANTCIDQYRNISPVVSLCDRCYDITSNLIGETFLCCRCTIELLRCKEIIVHHVLTYVTIPARYRCMMLYSMLTYGEVCSSLLLYDSRYRC